MGWTEEQKEAISYDGGSAIVSAAAGSGKTAVLVERVIRILKDEENPVNADELVVATFTEKAAGELKTRLNAALSSAIRENPESEHLKSQLLRLEDASISTISAFCLRLLRNNSAAAGLSPDFSIIDEAESRLLLSKSLETVLEEFYETASEADKALIYDWYGGENDSELYGYVSFLHGFLRKLPDPKKSTAQWLDIYENPDKYKEKYQQECIELSVRPLVSDIMSILPKPDPSEKKSFGYLTEWNDFLDKLAAISGVDPDAENVPSLDEILSFSPPAIPRKSKDFDNEWIKDLNKRLKGLWEKISLELSLSPDFSRNTAAAAPVIKILLDLAFKTDKEFSKRKQLKNKLDFADAEIFALRLLKNEKIASELRRCISVIIVDEFQDSNDMQYELFRALSRDGQNLFFVGDIKQSIYRFRGANPRVFSRVMEDPHFKKIYLNRNFRSNGKVIDSVNALFEGTMTRTLGEVEYDDNAKLTLGATIYTEDDSYNTELIRVFGENSPSARAGEAAYIADRIKSMVESGFTVTDKDGRRPCRYGDFAVLMGKYSFNAHIYKKAFRAASVPFEAKEDGAFTDFFEVKLMLSLLRIIDNPYYNRDIAAVLTLPPYSFTPDELAELKLAGGIKHKKLFSGIESYAKTNPKAKRFYDEFTELREFASEHSVEQLVRKIYDESDVVTAILAMPDGDKRGSNLRLLINYAKQFSENGIRGLYDFLGYMETISRSGVRLAEAQSAAASDNSVKIMTIHGSKGLEFPICVIANTPSLYVQKGTGKIAADIDAGIGMQAVDHKRRLVINTYLHQYINSLNTRQELSEEMRLLYVAATRAKEKLIFTAPVKSAEGYKSHLKWIMESRAVAKNLIKVEDIYDYKPEKQDKSEEQSSEKVIIKPFAEYKFLRYASIPAKVTATQAGVKSVDDFAEKVEEVDRFLPLPSFSKKDEPKKLKGKKKGDAYHKAMELMDFTGGVSQLDELFERGKLTETERASIDEKEVECFLASDLCRRINQSGEVYKEFPIFCEYCPDDFPEDEEKPFVQGIADLFFVENGEIVLVDYKTNSNATPDVLREEYEGQLKIYGEALEKMTGLKVKERYLWAFTLKKTVKI